MRSGLAVLVAVVVAGAGLPATATAAQPAAAHAPGTSVVVAAVPSAVPLARRAHRPRARLSLDWTTRGSGRVRVVARTNARKVVIRYRGEAGKSRTRVRKVRARSARVVLPAGARSIRVRTRATSALRASPWQRATPAAAPTPTPTPAPAAPQTAPAPQPPAPIGETQPPVPAPVVETPAPTAWEQEVVALVNEARAQARTCGTTSHPAAAPLTVNASLTVSARAHSADMAAKDYLSHTGRDGSLPWDRMRSAGYSYRAAGENIAAGQPSPASVMTAWLGSPGHCATIMSAAFTEIGVGHSQQGGPRYSHYWTQNFGHP